MSFSNVREDMNSTCRINPNALHLTTPLSSITRTPMTPQQTMMNYARMSDRYTTVTLLSMRPPPEITIFPDHLVERRFLDEENYIDLDRMLLEKAGKFDLESYNMRDGPIMPRRIHKYDFSDPTVIEKVKNRRPKDPLTPQQVASLTSVVTRYQPSLLPSSSSHQVQSSHVWIDDYSRQQVQHQRDSSHHYLRPQPSMPYQRQNPNQCETYTIPILQRLFEAQRLQQNEQRKIDPTQLTDSPGHYQKGLSGFCTPATPNNTFGRDENSKDVLTQFINEHVKCSTAMETPATPSFDMTGLNKIIRGGQEDDSPSLFNKPYFSNDQQKILSDNDRSTLEGWFGGNIYTNAYPRMPSGRVVSAYDLEQ